MKHSKNNYTPCAFPPPRLGVARFVAAQRKDKSFTTALSEIKNGRKTSHWIWYILPQLKGIGTSIMCDYYGIRDIKEARSYLRNKILRTHLRLILRALLRHSGVPILQILGSIDSLKLCSCVTLFLHAALTKIDADLCKKVLDTFFGGKEDPITLKMLGENPIITPQ